MKKYLIIDTWNGEGYTEPTVKIKEFKDDNEALAYCDDKAVETSRELMPEGSLFDTGEKNSCGYQTADHEDAGVVAFEEYTEDIVGLILNPMENSYKVYRDRRDWDDAIDWAYRNGDIEECEDEGVENFIEGKINQIYIHSGAVEGEDACFVIPQEDRELEFHESGDGTEYEIWKDKKTGKLYKVPIEIVRDFSNMEEVDSLFNAKFG